MTTRFLRYINIYFSSDKAAAVGAEEEFAKTATFIGRTDLVWFAKGLRDGEFTFSTLGGLNESRTKHVIEVRERAVGDHRLVAFAIYSDGSRLFYDSEDPGARPPRAPHYTESVAGGASLAFFWDEVLPCGDGWSAFAIGNLTIESGDMKRLQDTLIKIPKIARIVAHDDFCRIPGRYRLRQLSMLLMFMRLPGIDADTLFEIQA